MRFRLKMGRHVEGEGEDKKVFKKGDVIDSPHNLIKLFPEKFELVAGSELEPEEDLEEAEPGEKPPVPEPPPRKPAKAKAPKPAPKKAAAPSTEFHEEDDDE